MRWSAISGMKSITPGYGFSTFRREIRQLRQELPLLVHQFVKFVLQRLHRDQNFINVSRIIAGMFLLLDRSNNENGISENP